MSGFFCLIVFMRLIQFVGHGCHELIFIFVCHCGNIQQCVIHANADEHLGCFWLGCCKEQWMLRNIFVHLEPTLQNFSKIQTREGNGCVIRSIFSCNDNGKLFSRMLFQFTLSPAVDEDPWGSTGAVPHPVCSYRAWHRWCSIYIC